MSDYRFLKAFSFALLVPMSVQAQGFETDWSLTARALSGYEFSNHTDRNVQKKYAFPAYGKISADLLYRFDEETSLGLYTKLLGQSGVNLDNLNQGTWGEEVYGSFHSAYGDFELGQMPNVAATLAVTRPDFATWQPLSQDLADFIRNPNWAHHKHQKFYATLTSTVADADGSALKFSYYTPEWQGLTLALSVTPETNANDGLVSKFAPYHKESATTAAVYHNHDFGLFQSDAYLSYADYERSHQDYAGGLSLYRKGWTLFGLYRETDASSAAPVVSSALYDDGWRDARAWNAGVGYAFFYWNTSVSYFESKAKKGGACSRIWNWHNGFKFHQNYAFYAGLAYADYEPNRESVKKSVNGYVGYLGLELNF